MNKILVIFRENWFRILLSYGLSSVGIVLVSLYPKILGDTIDHLVVNDYMYIWRLSVIFGVFILLNYLSRVYDTKVFSAIYRRFSSSETNKQIENGVESTKINGRLTLMYNIISFFEYDIPTVLSTIIGLSISIYFISLVDISLVFWIIISGIVMVGLTYYFSPKIAKLRSLSNDLSEEQTDIVNSLRIGKINNLLRRKQKLEISSSNLDAKYSVLIEFVSYFSVTCLLVYYVTSFDVTIGSVFSTYRYMFDFCGSVIGITYLIPRLINMRDILNRLN